MAKWQYKISLYAKGKRVADSDLRRAKQFHVYALPPGHATYVRLTDSLEEIPSYIRSNAAKTEFILERKEELHWLEVEALKEFKRQERKRQREEAKRLAAEEAKRLAAEEAKRLAAEEALRREEEARLEKEKKPKVKKPKEKPEEVPPPRKKRVFFTFGDLGNIQVEIHNMREFLPRIRRMVQDSLGAQGLPLNKRHEDLFKEMYRAFKASPHLALDPKLYEGMLARNLSAITVEEKFIALKERADFWSIFNEKPRSDLGSPELDVTFRVKEVFSELRPAKDFDIETQNLLWQKPAQRVFLQSIGEYRELVNITRRDIKTGRALDMIDALRSDVKEVFYELHERGYFPFGADTAYTIRLFVPLYDSKGVIQQDYMSKDGEKEGGGYALPRMPIEDKDALDDVIEMLLSGLLVDMDDYIKRSRMSGFVIGGFMIERLLFQLGGEFVEQK